MPRVPLTHIDVELTKGNQVIIFLTATWLIILGILGIAPLPTIPINDKALHFFGVRFPYIAHGRRRLMGRWDLRLFWFTLLLKYLSMSVSPHHLREPLVRRLTNRGPARRVWYIRRAPLILTLVMSFFFGSIISEFIQGMLPVSPL